MGNDRDYGDNISTRLTYFLVGAGIGAVLALLFAPTASGELTVLDLGELYFREVSLVPSYSCGPTDTRAAYHLLRDGRVDPRPLITHRFPLEAINEAFDTFAERRGDAIKVVLEIGDRG